MHGKFNALMVTQRVGVGVVPYLNGAHPGGASTSEAKGVLENGVCGGFGCDGVGRNVAVCRVGGGR